MVGGHLDVSYDDVRAVGVSHPDQVAGVGGSAHHIESAVLQDADDPLPDEGLVLTDDDANRPRRAHGITPASPARSGGSGIRIIG